jgi:hypothetical protein
MGFRSALDHRHLEGAHGGDVAHDGGDLVQAGALGGAPAALAGDQLIAALAAHADDHRLDHALGADRIGQLGQAGVVE